MARFQPIRQTLAGLAIQAQAQAGAPLTFTRVQIGDAIAPAAYTAVLGTDAPLDLDDVVSPVRVAPIISVDAIDQGRARVRAMADNRDAALPFMVRELGIFATDPLDGVEKLYAYTNAGDGFDSIPADDGSPPTELVYDLMTIIGAAQNVTAGFNSQVCEQGLAGQNGSTPAATGCRAAVSALPGALKTTGHGRGSCCAAPG